MLIRLLFSIVFLIFANATCNDNINDSINDGIDDKELEASLYNIEGRWLSADERWKDWLIEVDENKGSILWFYKGKKAVLYTYEREGQLSGLTYREGSTWVMADDKKSMYRKGGIIRKRPIMDKLNITVTCISTTPVRCEYSTGGKYVVYIKDGMLNMGTNFMSSLVYPKGNAMFRLIGSFKKVD